jgi:hypothetical protein
MGKAAKRKRARQTEWSEPSFTFVIKQIEGFVNTSIQAGTQKCYCFLTNEEKGYSPQMIERVRRWSQGKQLPIDLHLWLKPVEEVDK